MYAYHYFFWWFNVLAYIHRAGRRNNPTEKTWNPSLEVSIGMRAEWASVSK